MVCSDRIPAFPQIRILLEFRSKPICGKENNSEFCSVDLKKEAIFQNFVPKPFAEENTLSVLFAGTGNFRFESLVQKATAKNSVRKEDF
jgi:hypothetical protein